MQAAGKFVALHPYQVILSCLIATACCSLGLLKFREETKANLLWIPPDSEYNYNQDWVDANFTKSTREEFALFKSDNVLTPDSLQQVWSLILYSFSLSIPLDVSSAQSCW